MERPRSRLVARRDELDLSQDQVAHTAGIHPKTLSKIERGLSTPQRGTRRKLAEALAWSADELKLALETNSHNGAVNGHRVPAHLSHFASLEQGATELRSWAPLMVPGLLQTRAYALAVERADLDSPSEADLARWVAVRMERQAVLRRDPDPLTLHAVLDASVLLRATGGSDVMAGQIRHLVELNKLANVSIRVAPLDARTFIAPVGAFHIFSDDARAPYLACPTDLTGVQYIENPPTLVAAYVDTFAALWERSDDLDQVELLG